MDGWRKSKKSHREKQKKTGPVCWNVQWNPKKSSGFLGAGNLWAPPKRGTPQKRLTCRIRKKAPIGIGGRPIIGGPLTTIEDVPVRGPVVRVLIHLFVDPFWKKFQGTLLGVSLKGKPKGELRFSGPL